MQGGAAAHRGIPPTLRLYSGPALGSREMDLQRGGRGRQGVSSLLQGLHAVAPGCCGARCLGLSAWLMSSGLCVHFPTSSSEAVKGSGEQTSASLFIRFSEFLLYSL